MGGVYLRRGRDMYRTVKNFEIELRLNEINRRSIALSATSLELACLAAQLDHLRQANERISDLAGRMALSNPRRSGDCFSRKL
jgi:hypothetical protein